MTVPRLSSAAIRRLIAPRSVAVVGASPTRGSLGQSVLQNLLNAGYAGDIHLVNPRRAEIDGRRCVASVAALPHGVDCAVLAIPRVGVLESVAQCAAQGVGGVIIFSAGFAEEGEAGLAEQRQIADLAAGAGMVVEGPNCLGLINYVDGVPLSFVDTPGVRLGERPGIGVVSQSGALAAVVGVGFFSRDLGISYSVSTGNEAGSGVEDYVAFLLEDPHTQVIALVVEQFRQPSRFLELATRARMLGKPVVLLHPGRSAAARASAATHTGAMAGDDAVMRIKVTQAGVVLTETLEEFLDVAELLLRCPPATGRGVAVLTESGAFRALSLDFCESVGIDLPTPGEATREAWRAAFPPFVLPVNPLDLTAQGLVDPELYGHALAPLLADPAYGAVVLSLILTNVATSDRKFQPVLAALERLRPAKPVIFTGMDDGAVIDPAKVAALRARGVPFFPSTERALRALARFLAATPTPAPTGATATMPIAEGIAIPPGVMAEYQAKQILHAIGIAIPDGGLATSLEQAQAIAQRIGYPVVLKAQAAALSHKSDVGGVVLNLADAAALAVGWRTLAQAIASGKPGLVLDGVLVETMAPRGTELIVGARRDPDWGAVLLVGFGGVMAEAVRDVRLLPADLPVSAILAELDLLRGAAVLRGFRGAPPLDVAAAADLIARLGALMQARPEIVEVDINPVVIRPVGQGVLALDALIVSA